MSSRVVADSRRERSRVKRKPGVRSRLRRRSRRTPLQRWRPGRSPCLDVSTRRSSQSSRGRGTRARAPVDGTAHVPHLEPPVFVRSAQVLRENLEERFVGRRPRTLTFTTNPTWAFARSKSRLVHFWKVEPRVSRGKKGFSADRSEKFQIPTYRTGAGHWSSWVPFPCDPGNPRDGPVRRTRRAPPGARRRGSSGRRNSRRVLLARARSPQLEILVL